MPMSGKTINIGGKEFNLPPKLKLRQLRDISAISSRPLPEDDPEALERFHCDTCAEIISTALIREYPEVTVEYILDSEMTIQELLRTRLDIILHSGLISERPKAGEGVAKAA